MTTEIHRDAGTYRDAWGIPHLRADSADELAHAQGRATARDRAWQLETERHRAQGTSAAFLGTSALPWDLFARRTRLTDTAKRCFAALERRDPETARWIRAYVDGVNEGLGEASSALERGGMSDGTSPPEDEGLGDGSPVPVNEGLGEGSSVPENKGLGGGASEPESVGSGRLPGRAPGAAGSGLAQGRPSGSVGSSRVPGRAPEFAKSGLKPGRWEPWTPLAVWLATHILFAGFPAKLWREEAIRHLGADAVGLFATDGPGTSGSNGWLMSGARTATGLPVLAGDPHRFIEDPGVYQQVHLSCPEFDVVGLAVPGVPGIAHFGHTGTVAWAITNAMADYQDLYRERLRRTGAGVEALGPDGVWRRAARHTETVEVAGEEPVEVEVIETERGPVVIGGPEGLDGGLTAPPGTPPLAISLRHPPRVTEDLGFSTLLPLLRARQVADVDRAFDDWAEPVNVVQAADAEGGLLHRVAGKVPVRAEANRTRLVPAWEPGHEWHGWHEPPHAEPSADGIAVMANQRGPATPPGHVREAPPSEGAPPIPTPVPTSTPTPRHPARTPTAPHESPTTPTPTSSPTTFTSTSTPSTKSPVRHTETTHRTPQDAPPPPLSPSARPTGLPLHNLGIEFAPPHRADRITELLTARPHWSAADMPAIHMDTHLGSAGPLLDHLAALTDLTPEATALRDRLQRWDRRMDADSTDAAAYAAVRGAVVRRIAAHPVFAALAEPPAYPEVFQPWLALLPRVGFALEHLLRATELYGIDRPETVRAAVEEVAAAPPGTWGDTHRLTPWRALPGTSTPGPDLSGDHDCVLCTSSVPGLTDLSARGPAARFVWNLARREDSLWVVPGGASGDPDSPHHHDQLPLWLKGEMAPVITDFSLLRPERPERPERPVRRPVHEQHVDGFGTVRVLPLDPAADAATIHRWVRDERAAFWGMNGLTQAQVAEIYAHMDTLDTHHAHLVLRDDEPVALLQTYDPAADRVGDCYAVEPGDIGIHLLLAPAGPDGARPGWSAALMGVLAGYVLLGLDRRRVVVDPDVRNERAIARFLRQGFVAGPEVVLPEIDIPDVYLPEKRAQLAFLPREVAFP